MATAEIGIDMTDWDAIIEYVAAATADWPASKREALRLELLSSLERGLDVHPEGGRFVAQATPSLFAVLNRHGLNPVC